MIYNSNPYKRKMESMQVNVAPSVPSKPDEPTKPVPEQAPVQESMPDPMVKTQPILEQPVPYAPATPELEVTPYVPEVEGVEVPAVSLEDIEPSNPVEEVEAAQPEEVEAPAEEAEVETPADATGEETAAEEVPATHYFYCTKPDGKEVVYKRNTASASYESEIASFRKYLEKEGIIINKEEIK